MLARIALTLSASRRLYRREHTPRFLMSFTVTVMGKRFAFVFVCLVIAHLQREGRGRPVDRPFSTPPVTLPNDWSSMPPYGMLFEL